MPRRDCLHSKVLKPPSNATNHRTLSLRTHTLSFRWQLSHSRAKMMEGQVEVEMKPPLPKWEVDATEEEEIAALEEEGNFDRNRQP